MKVAWDANGDGIITISDIWLLVKWLACIPGNSFLDAITTYTPRVATFFEVSDLYQYNSFAWIFSAVVWVFTFAVISSGLTDN